MEGRESVAPRTESSTQTAAPPYAAAAAPGFQALMVPAKKKRGRPRKYGPDGGAKIALSPEPISAAPPPPVIDFSVQKLGEVKSASKSKCEVENSGEWVASSVGANFTMHIIPVNTGEDVTMKIISFSQQGPRAICVISANGVISSVTLRQPDSSGGTLTYEGRFEILTLSGSFIPSDSGGTRCRSGGMSVSLVGPDGRVVGGGLAGLLVAASPVAASPVQIVVGSFLAGNQHELKPKKQKHESISMSTIATAAIPISSASPRVDLSSSSSFRGDNWSSKTSNKPTDINISFEGQS